MRPSPAEVDDDNDLWPPDNTQERSFWTEAVTVLGKFSPHRTIYRGVLTCVYENKVEGDELIPVLEETETTHAVATTTATGTCYVVTFESKMLTCSEQR